MTRKQFTLFDTDEGTVIDADVDLADFFVVHDIEPDEANAIGALGVGAEWMLGGGAAPAIVLRRVS